MIIHLNQAKIKNYDQLRLENGGSSEARQSSPVCNGMRWCDLTGAVKIMPSIHLSSLSYYISN